MDWGSSSHIALYASLGLLTSALLGMVLRAYVLRPLSLLREMRAQGVPGHPFRFFIGQIGDIFEMESKRAANPDLAAATKSSQYWFDGTTEFGSVWTFFSGRKLYVTLADPGLARQAYVTHNDSFDKSESFAQTPLLNGGVLVTNGSQWGKQRRLLNPAFAHKELRRMFPTMVQCASEAVASLEARVAKGEPTSVMADVAFSSLTLDIICRSAFGAHLGKMGEQLIESVTQIVAPFFDDSMTQMYMGDALPGFNYLPLPVNFRVRKSGKVLEKAMRQIVDARLARWKALKEGGASGEWEDQGRTDLLQLMMEATEGTDANAAVSEGDKLLSNSGNKDQQSQQSTMSADELMANCFTFLIAGHETTSQLLTWTGLLLSQRPEWQEKARDEVNALYAANGGETPSFEQLKELKVVAMILQESMRLYPPVTVIDRVCTKNARLSEKLTIPEGCHIMIPIEVFHRSKEYWGDDVDAFRPERFAEGASKAALHPNAFMPFSVGPRHCIGQSFAMAEARIILAMFLRKFSWKLGAGYQHYPEATLTQHPKHGMPLELTLLQES